MPDNPPSEWPGTDDELFASLTSAVELTTPQLLESMRFAADMIRHPERIPIKKVISVIGNTDRDRLDEMLRGPWASFFAGLIVRVPDLVPLGTLRRARRVIRDQPPPEE
jgi:hypothetical protein